MLFSASKYFPTNKVDLLTNNIVLRTICMMTVSRNATNDIRTESTRLAYGSPRVRLICNFSFSGWGEPPYLRNSSLTILDRQFLEEMTRTLMFEFAQFSSQSIVEKIISGQTIENVSAWLHQVPQLWLQCPGVAMTGVNSCRYVHEHFEFYCIYS